MKLCEVLNQDEVWVGGDHHAHRLDAMTDDQRAALLVVLRPNAPSLAARCKVNTGLVSAADWLESTPFMQRLVELGQRRTRREQAS